MHDIRRLPGAKVITGLLWLVLLAGLLAWLAVHYLNIPGLAPKTEVDEHISLSVLRSKELMFLVCRRVVSQVIVEHQEVNWIGRWRGILWGTVTIHYGIDLERIQPGDVRREDGLTLVKLPEPGILSLSLEPDSIGFMSKSTLAPKLTDLLNNGHRKLLEGRLRESALEFAQRQDLLPGRDELVGQLNDAVSLLAGAGNARLRFE